MIIPYLPQKVNYSTETGKEGCLTMQGFWSRHPAMLSVFMLGAAVFLTMSVQGENSAVARWEEEASSLSSASSVSSEAQPIQQQEEILSVENPDEVRAVWVPYMSLDMRGGDGSAKTFEEKFDEIVSTSKKTRYERSYSTGEALW